MQRTSRIYRQYLSHFLVFRCLLALSLHIFRFFYIQFSKFKNKEESGEYVWRSLASTNSNILLRYYAVLSGTDLFVPAPAFCGWCATAAAARTQPVALVAPAIGIYQLKRSLVVGGVDFVFADNEAIHHDLFRPDKHRFPAENLGVITTRNRDGGVNLNLTMPTGEIDNAITMIGQCSNNYAHWLTETLPKLPILDQYQGDVKSPILIDANLHPNIRASVDLINTHHRTVIEVERWHPLRVNDLMVVSAPGYERYVPSGICLRDPAPYINSFSPAALKMLRAAVNRALGDRDIIGSRQIYLARGGSNSNLRKLENTLDVEDLLRHRGVSLAIPEKMSFADQALACLKAELIVAPIGAGLANMIFAPTGCRIVILAPYYENASFSYFTNLANALGHDLNFVLGQQVGAYRHPMHRDYRVRLEDLCATLNGVDIPE